MAITKAGTPKPKPALPDLGIDVSGLSAREHALLVKMVGSHLTEIPAHPMIRFQRKDASRPFDAWAQLVTTAWRARWESQLASLDVEQIGRYARVVGDLGPRAQVCLPPLLAFLDMIARSSSECAVEQHCGFLAIIRYAVVKAGTLEHQAVASVYLANIRYLAPESPITSAYYFHSDLHRWSTKTVRLLADFHASALSKKSGRSMGAKRWHGTVKQGHLFSLTYIFLGDPTSALARPIARGLATGVLHVEGKPATMSWGYGAEYDFLHWARRCAPSHPAWLREEAVFAGLISISLTGKLPWTDSQVHPHWKDDASELVGSVAANT